VLIEGFLHVFFFDRWIYDVEHSSSSLSSGGWGAGDWADNAADLVVVELDQAAEREHRDDIDQYLDQVLVKDGLSLGLQFL